MKINQTYILLALTVTTLAVPAARAQDAVRADTSGTLLTPLNLGSAKVSGTLSPDHLGTGTPSSATVLRGDGTWSGTTSTGNTVAATGNLLIGDSAGNAAAVTSQTALLRTLQTRLETARAGEVPPANLLPAAYQINATFNPDGTITVPANGSVNWWLVNALDNNFAGQTLYAYVVATADAPYGALSMQQQYIASTTSTLCPGAYRSVLTIANADEHIVLRNSSSAPVTVYYPVLAALDTGLAAITSHADQTAVSTQPVVDFDFTKFPATERVARYAAEKLTTVASTSFNGSNNGSAGTLYTPSGSLQQSVTNGSVFGLYRGSVFADSLPLSALASDGSSHGIVIQDVGLGQPGPLPIVSALRQVPNGSFTSNGDGTYTYTWTPQDSTIANDGYQNVYVVEINTATEATSPVAARQRMIDVMSQSAAASTVGSAWVQPSTSPVGWKAVIHPSDGLAPGSGAYRYEVVSRYAPARFGDATYAGDAAVAGLELIGSSWGYGAIGGPTGFVGDRLAVLHCSSHGAVLGGGSLSRSVFYEQSSLAQSNANGAIQLAWYTHASATNLCWAMDHCLFYTKGSIPGSSNNDRLPYAVISHTSDGSNYKRGDISDCALLGGRYASGALKGTAIDYVNVAGGTINRVYTQGFKAILGNAMPLAAEVKNSVFQDCQSPQVGVNFHDNIVLAQSATDPASNANYPIALLLYQNGANASNNILWSHGLSGYTQGSSDQAYGIQFFSGVTTATAQRNIIILDPANVTTSSTYVSLPSGSLAGYSVDYNLVINLNKGGFSTTGGTGNTSSWPQYIATYGTLDQHSLYLDLSGDQRGLKAVFVDPLNGDFRWAQTDVARRCAAYCKANNVGPVSVISHWPTVPTVDDAVRLLSSL